MAQSFTANSPVLFNLLFNRNYTMGTHGIMQGKKALLTLLIAAISTAVFGQVYFNNFGTTAISGSSYTGSPTLETGISGGAWTTSAGNFTSFAGSSGQALSLGNSSGTPTYTLSLTVATGYKLDVSAFSFWRQRSTAGAQNWSMTINGIAVGSGTVPTSGSSTGSLTPTNTVSNVTGNFTVVLSLSGASGAGTFRLDDFTLTGTVSPLTPTTTSINPTSGTAGGPGFTLTVNGTNFISGVSTVRWNGSNRSTTFVSATQLTATINAADIASAGSATVDVLSTGNATASNGQTFTINSGSSPSLVCSALSGFGNVCTGTTAGPNSFTITGTALTTANVTVGALSGFTYSTTSGGSYTTTLSLAQGGGSYSQTIYVKFDPTAVQSYNGNIPVGGGGTSAATDVAATGSGVNTTATIGSPTATGIAATTAVLGGNITAIGCSNVTERGIYWSTTNGFTPPGQGTKVSTTGTFGTGTFTENVSSLPANTTIYYQAFATNSGGTVYTTQGNFTTYKEEPTNQATAFACGTTTAATIPVTWTDAAGGTTPDGYLIKWSNVSYAAITDPVDGNAEVNSAGVQNVTQGTQTYTLSGLSSSTTYYVKVWAYTNSGTAINYKLTGVPQTSCATLTGPCISNDFASTTFPPTGWAGTNVTRSTSSTDYVSSPAGVIFGSSNGTLTLSAAANPTSMTFYLGRSSNTTAKTMNVRVSTTSQTGPFTTVATYDHSNVPSGSYDQYTVDLSAYSSNATVYIQFEKVSSTSSPWRLDDVEVYCAPAAADINVTGNSVNIADGHTTPSVTDHTMFANTEVGSSSTRTFTIENAGTTGTINISSVTENGSAFAITTAPSSTALTAGQNTTFVVTFSPSATGAQSAVVTIANDDPDAAEQTYTFTISGTGTNSQGSDVAESGTSYTANIDYTQFQTTPGIGGATTGTVGVAQLRTRDGGATNTDNDNQPTTLTALKFTVKDHLGNNRISQIRHAVLATTGGSIFAVATITGTELEFSNVAGWSQTAAADNSNSANYVLRVSYNSTGILDNTKLVYEVSGAEALATGSTLAAANGGGATSDNNNGNNNNRIVVTASMLQFAQQPTNTSISANMSPAVTVAAVDANGNTDTDYTGTVSVTSTGNLDSSPKTAALSSGVASFSNILHTVAGNNFTLTATLSPLTPATSTAFNVSTIVFANGDYRSIGTGNWLNNQASPAIWERFNGSTWVASNSPAYNTTDNVYIQNSTVISTGGSFANGVKLKVMSGGWFNNGHSSTAGSIYVYDGGTLQINASLSVAGGGSFEVEDNGTVNINFAYGTPATSLWNGTENFHPASNLVFQDWDAANDNLIPDNTSISTNTYAGYTAAFGNVILDFDANLGSSDDWVLLAGGTNINLAHGDLIFRTNSTSGADMRLSTTGTVTSGIGGDFIVEDSYTGTQVINLKTSGTLNFTIKGDMQLDAATTRILAGSSGTSIVTVDGNLNITPSAVLEFNPSVAGGTTSVLNLKGDLTVAASGLLQNTNSSALGTLNFAGTGDGLTAATTQTIDIASTGANRNRNIAFDVNSGAFVQLINQKLELGVNSTFNVANGGKLHFGFDGSNNPLIITNVSGATSVSFSSQQNSTLYITSHDGLVKNTANAGNVQLPTADKSFNQTATFYYIGKDNQATGDGLTSSSTGKVVYVILNNNAKMLTVTNDIGISNTTTIDAQGGRLEIQKGTVLGKATGDFIGNGRLVMTDGIYQIDVLSLTLPQLSGYSNYSLTGGTVELNGNGDQTLSGTPTYYNVKISGTNTLGANKKTVSSNTTINNNLEVTGTSVFDTETKEVSGTAGLTMNSGLWRMSRTTGSPSLPQITGFSTPYSITGGTIEYYGTNATTQHLIRGTYGPSNTTITYYNMEVNADAANETDGNVNAGSSFNVAGTLNVNSPAILRLDANDVVYGTGVFKVNSNAGMFYANQYGIVTGTGTGSTDGAVRVTGGRTYSKGTYGFIGSGNMETGNGLPGTVNKLFLLKNNAADLITPNNNIVVTTAMGFSKGVLTLGGKTLTLAAGTAVTGTPSDNSFVATNGSGQLFADVATGTPNITLPVGDITGTYEYSPVTFSFAANANAGTIGVKAFDAVHPNMGSAANYLSRYWSFTNTGLTTYNYTSTFTYAASDIVGNSTTYKASRWNGSTWNAISGSSAAGTTLNVTTAQTETTSPISNDYTGRFEGGTAIWIGTTTQWANPANWSTNVVPGTCADDVIIPSSPTGGNFPVIGLGSFTVGNLTVNDGARISINNTQSLSVCGNFTGGTAGNSFIIGTGKLILSGSAQQTLSGRATFETLRLKNSAGAQLAANSFFDVFVALELESGELNTTNGSLTFRSISSTEVAVIDDYSAGFGGTLTGNIKAQRYYDAPSANSYNQHYVSSPVNAATLSSLGTSGTAGYVINPTCDETQSGAGSPYGTVFEYDETNGAACGLQGWKVLTASAGNTVNGKGYSVAKNGSGTFTLTGAANLLPSYTVSGLTNSNWSNTSVQGRTMGSGWYLAGNPYLAALNLQSTPDAGMDAQVHIWNTTTGMYDEYIIGVDATIPVAPFQAFMVHKSTPGGSATYTIHESDRTRSITPVFYQGSGNELVVYATNANGLTDKTRVAFNQQATDGFDAAYDAHKMFGLLSNHTLYTVNGGQLMSRNNLNNLQQTTTVPMGMHPGSNGGTFTFTFGGLQSFDATSYIYLEDLSTGAMINVREQNSYTFTMNPGETADRFVLHFTPAAVITTAPATCQANGMLNIEQPGSANWQYTVRNNAQTTLAAGTLNNSHAATVSLPAGQYTVTLVDNNQYTVVKTVEVTGATALAASFTASSLSVETGEIITFTNTSNSTATQWQFSDGTLFTNVQQPTYAFTQPGVYTVELQVSNSYGCNATAQATITVTQSTTTGIGNVNAEADVNVYSHANRVVVDFGTTKGINARVSVFNLLGQEISTGTTVNKVYTAEVTGMEAGYVIVKVTNNNRVTTRKVFISNR